MRLGTMQRSDRSNTAQCWKLAVWFGTLSLLVPQAQASYLFIVHAGPPDMDLEPAQRRKECDSERVRYMAGGVKGVSRGSSLRFARQHGGSRMRKGDIGGRRGLVSRSLEGWGDDFMV